MEYSSTTGVIEDGEQSAEKISLEPGADANSVAPDSDGEVDQIIQNLPTVKILLKETPEELLPSRFLAAMVDHVLSATPVTMHKEARGRRANAASLPKS